jgi:release factor glutamine methyltransferase
LLKWTTGFFQRTGIESPRLNAEVLLSRVLGMERIMLYARFDEPVSETHRAQFRELVRRRSQHEPLQYLVGEWEFYGRTFQVTPAVLIPRQETELLVQQCLERIPAGSRWAADIGTGSGAIAVSLAAERPELNVVAVDSSEEALAVAARNAEHHGVSDRVHLVVGDLCSPVAEALPPERAGVDLLVSNPPYIPSATIDALAPEVKDHEPLQALDGGPDGLDVVRRLLPAAAAVLLPEGWLALEIGERQVAAVRDLVAGITAFDAQSVETSTDAGGCERVVCVRRTNS